MVCRKGRARLDVRAGQIGKILKDLRIAHNAGEIFQHISQSDSKAANAGLTAALAKVECDDIKIGQSVNTHHRND